ncbi:hypothetical protein OHQ88_03835 [Micromonospora zamorensis]|uniref:Uncharacterized protein n=1 Tax=Micromonospora zamorensis TaxID=709883 RepID=A0ABZ1PIJ6_9ACTN
MAIEWNSRVNRAFILRDALDLTGVRLADLIGWPDARRRIEVREASMARRRGGASGPVAPSLLGQRIDPHSEQSNDVDVYLEIPIWEAAVLVHLREYDQRSEDPETGMFAWVTAERTNMSQVLAIAATIALAECGDGEVIDEYGYLSDVRLNPPAELFERLRVTAPQDSAAAADAVLAKTRLKRRFPRSDTPPAASPRGVA